MVTILCLEGEVLSLRISAQGFRKLVAYLDGSFARNGAARAPSIGPGLRRFSRFYPAQGEFHLFNTCNTWTAGGLKAADLPIEVSGTVSADDLLTQVRQWAVHPPDSGLPVPPDRSDAGAE